MSHPFPPDTIVYPSSKSVFADEYARQQVEWLWNVGLLTSTQKVAIDHAVREWSALSRRVKETQ